MARPRVADPKIADNLSLIGSRWEWLALWHPGNKSDQVNELLDRAMKFWPDGPGGNLAARGAAPRPGGVRDLRREVKLLRQQLRALGVEPNPGSGVSPVAERR